MIFAQTVRENSDLEWKYIFIVIVKVIVPWNTPPRKGSRKMETIIMLLLQPTGIAVFLILMAFFCLLLKPIRRYSVIPFSLSGVIILIFSTGTMASLLLSPL